MAKVEEDNKELDRLVEIIKHLTCTELDASFCHGNCIIHYVYDSNFSLPQRNLQEAKQKLEKKKAKVRAYLFGVDFLWPISLW